MKQQILDVRDCTADVFLLFVKTGHSSSWTQDSRFAFHRSERQLGLFAFGIAGNVMLAGANIKFPEPTVTLVSSGTLSSAANLNSSPFNRKSAPTGCAAKGV
jgi:hypothetical protein